MSTKRFPKLRLLNQLDRITWTIGDWRSEMHLRYHDGYAGAAAEEVRQVANELQRIESDLLSIRRQLRLLDVPR